VPEASQRPESEAMAVAGGGIRVALSGDGIGLEGEQL